MSIEIPAWGAGEMMVRARRKLFKMGWKQMENGRLDCIEKTFGEVVVTTIWAGNALLLSFHRLDGSYVSFNDALLDKVASELVPIFDGIVKKHKKEWDADIKEYEKLHGIVFIRSPKYGV
jgi:hypothetical protein